VVRSAGLRWKVPGRAQSIAVELSVMHNVWEEPHAATFVLTGIAPPSPCPGEIYRNDLWRRDKALVIIDLMPPSLPIRVLPISGGSPSGRNSQTDGHVEKARRTCRLWRDQTWRARKAMGCAALEWNRTTPIGAT